MFRQDIPMDDQLSKAETAKDSVQATLDAAAETVTTVTSIIVGAVRDVAKAIGDLGTEVFEIRDAAKKAHPED
jgi:uncharacterized phage infection (PIP) family protein YhgE